MSVLTLRISSCLGRSRCGSFVVPTFALIEFTLESATWAATPVTGGANSQTLAIVVNTIMSVHGTDVDKSFLELNYKGMLVFFLVKLER